MANEKTLEQRIKSAEVTLKGSFGNTADSLDRSYGRTRQTEGDYLDIGVLSDLYKDEANRKDIARQFLSVAKSIRKMRSSYLNTEFFKPDSPNEEEEVEDLADTTNNLESYENTFLRMLGMPSVSTAELGVSIEDIEIRTSDSIYVIDPASGELKLKPFAAVRDILEQRKKTKTERSYLIDNSIYNISTGVLNNISYNEINISQLSTEDKADLLDLGIDESGNIVNDNGGPIIPFPTTISREDQFSSFINPVRDEPIPDEKVSRLVVTASDEDRSVNIAKISQDIWKFCYLLVPPIQDYGIANYINEPEKIVAPLFTTSKVKKINNVKTRPALLESVIRIRLDKASGTNTFTKKGVLEEDDALFKLDGTDVRSDDYGILESLFILRLRSAISGLAKKLVADIDVIISEMEKSNTRPSTNSDDDLQGTERTSAEAGSPSTDVDQPANPQSFYGYDIDLLNQQKLVEDSIMFLLGDNSEALDLQAQTQRTSSIYDSHMMSGLIDVIDVPRKGISQRLVEINDAREQHFSEAVEPKMQEINTCMGTDIGIGTIDLAVFSLALFTISEESLLGLLSKAQYDRIKNGEFKKLLTNTERNDSVASINELTKLIHEGYSLFLKEIQSDSRPDSTPDDTEPLSTEYEELFDDEGNEGLDIF
jgi:hypothetical protein